MPVARFGLYDSAAVHDAVSDSWSIVVADHPSFPEDRPSVDARFRQWKEIFNTAGAHSLPAPPEQDEPQHNMSYAQYLQMVRQGREYIAAGDIFQVNLARRESYPVQEPPLETYLRLRRTNPGAYAAFVAWGNNHEKAIISASPELFLQLHDRRVLTRPIKGTRPRLNDPQVDAAYRQELAESVKDRAELAMIVDLERNDIGRVCEFGSVQVICPDDSPAKPYALEAHPTVYHLVADVTGRLRKDVDAVDLLRACFPGGSITGAPKVRAMEIIDELEPSERGVYTGAIGYLGLNGDMMMNIPIRTMIASCGQLHIYAGGGIVADSVPEEEYTETQAKALGLCRALGLDMQHATTSRRGSNTHLKIDGINRRM
jgi:para-aminobenzoate synthetase component 1